MTQLMMRAAGFLALSIVVAGCRPAEPRPVSFAERSRPLQSKDYHDIRARWTRHAKVVSDQGTVIEVWATLKSAEFRQAYVEHYAAIYRLAEDERAKLREDQIARAREVYEFHLTAQSTELAWNDLERKSSAWKITLVDGSGAALEPASVEVPRLPELYENEFFPTRTPFTRTYVVRFRVPPADDPGGFDGPASGRVALRLASPFGTAELVWRAERS